MRNILLSFFLAVGLSTIAQNGMPYGVWEQGPFNYWFVQVNPSTGVKTNIAQIPGMSAFVAGNKTTFDYDRGYYHFVGHNGTDALLYTINATSGAIVSSPIFNDNVVGLEYNCTDSLIYGIFEKNNGYWLVTVDPATAVMDTISVLYNVNAYVGGSFSLDTKRGLYSAVLLDQSTLYLRSFDIFSGTRVYNNPFPDNVVNHEYNCEDSAVYGMWDDNNQYKLEKIDLASGAHTTAGIISAATPGNISEATTINDSGEYTFRGFVTSTFSVHVVDVATASSVWATPQPDNVVGWEEPYCCLGKRAPADTTGDTTGTNGLIEYNNPTFSISPNPANDQLVIESGLPIRSIEVLDVKGARVMSHVGTRSREVLNVRELKDGLYFIRLETSEGITQRKLIVAR